MIFPVLVISIHPPRTGWDSADLSGIRSSRNFNPPTPHGVGLAAIISSVISSGISIHPPRTGWDSKQFLHPFIFLHFNPPTPHGVGQYLQQMGKIMEIFQSTHPARGGTRAGPHLRRSAQFQSTHPARGGTPKSAFVNPLNLISIHPPRTGWDANANCRRRRLELFQSTHPARGGTFFEIRPLSTARISIHPPRTGWDGNWGIVDGLVYEFQSTHPARGGTPLSMITQSPVPFQSTHPARGGTRGRTPGLISRCDFNPPTPHGVGLSGHQSGPGRAPISIHPPRTGWDHPEEQPRRRTVKFQSTHPARGGTFG